MRLLQKVEKSVLWLIKPHESAINNMYTEIINNGIDKDRLIFAERMQLDKHIMRHSCGDLFLDTFNFNAATTANIALFSGLPIITLKGKSYSARMAASVLNSYKLNDLITHNELEYESLAYELATNKEKLLNVRQRIKDKLNSMSYDSIKFTRNLENIYNNIRLK